MSNPGGISQIPEAGGVPSPVTSPTRRVRSNTMADRPRPMGSTSLLFFEQLNCWGPSARSMQNLDLRRLPGRFGVNYVASSDPAMAMLFERDGT